MLHFSWAKWSNNKMCLPILHLQHSNTIVHWLTHSALKQGFIIIKILPWYCTYLALTTVVKHDTCHHESSRHYAFNSFRLSNYKPHVMCWHLKDMFKGHTMDILIKMLMKTLRSSETWQKCFLNHYNMFKANMDSCDLNSNNLRLLTLSILPWPISLHCHWCYS